MEIYHEMLRDLIHQSKEVMDLRKDPYRNIVVAGLSDITSPEEVVSSILWTTSVAPSQKPTKPVSAHTQCYRSMSR